MVKQHLTRSQAWFLAADSTTYIPLSGSTLPIHLLYPEPSLQPFVCVVGDITQNFVCKRLHQPEEKYGLGQTQNLLCSIEGLYRIPVPDFDLHKLWVPLFNIGFQCRNGGPKVRAFFAVIRHKRGNIIFCVRVY